MKEQLKHELSKEIANKIGKSQPEVYALLGAPKNKDFGDVAFPCFLLAKELKTSPVECASKLAQELSLPTGIKDVIPTGPFINFRYDTTALGCATLKRIIDSNGKFAFIEKRPQTILVEFSSPNIAKPFHVGHLRATLIGNCLDRVYRYLNYNTISINHLGDWGTQFGFVYAGCKLWGKPKNDDVLELLDTYRKATDLKAAQENNSVSPEEQNLPDINEMARMFFVDLEAGASYAEEFWKYCLEISLEYLKKTYNRFGITFDNYTGESFYRDKMDAVKNELDQAGILRESQGAIGVDLGEELGFARIYTPDGRSLYLTRDIAAVLYRADTFNFDRCIYVVGVPQTLHFRQLKAIVKALGHDYAEKIAHVAFGHVAGIKTRGKGQFIELNAFLDEAESRALQTYQEQVTKRPAECDENNVAEAVALAAIIFSNLNKTSHIDVTFNWESALSFQGDSGPYLLYAYARISSIKEKFIASGGKYTTEFNAALLTEDSAHNLVNVLSDFDNVVEKTARENEPSNLTQYALEIAKAFSKCYLDLKVVGADPDIAQARLCLFEATRIVLGEVLRLLGITPISRM